MQAQLQRCKTIVSGILLSAGEARGEAPVETTLHAFLDELVARMAQPRAPAQRLHYEPARCATCRSSPTRRSSR